MAKKKPLKIKTMFVIKTPQGEIVNRLLYLEEGREKQLLTAQRWKERWLECCPEIFPYGLVIVEE